MKYERKKQHLHLHGTSPQAATFLSPLFTERRSTFSSRSRTRPENQNCPLNQIHHVQHVENQLGGSHHVQCWRVSYIWSLSLWRPVLVLHGVARWPPLVTSGRSPGTGPRKLAVSEGGSHRLGSSFLGTCSSRKNRGKATPPPLDVTHIHTVDVKWGVASQLSTSLPVPCQGHGFCLTKRYPTE